MVKVFLLGFVCSKAFHSIVDELEFIEFAVSVNQGEAFWNKGSDKAITMRVMVRHQSLVDFCRKMVHYGTQVMIDAELREDDGQQYLAAVDIRLPGLRSKDIVFTAQAAQVKTLMSKTIRQKGRQR